jgi:DNA polymerase-3 subunit alpha (Gram-positive type)
MKYYTVVDLEWTSWKKNYYGKHLKKEKREIWQKKEIIQIAAIKFNKYFKIVKKINILVKPKINKKLSGYITKLTSITDRILEIKGINFQDAFKKLKKFSNKSVLFCNGKDSAVLNKNLFYNKIKEKKIIIFNIKKIFKNKYNVPEKYLHSPVIKTFFGYKYNRKKAHNALYDCQSIIFAMKKMNFNLKFLDDIKNYRN